MADTAIPARFPATSNDLATSVVRAFGQHMEIGLRLTFDRHLDADVLRRAVRASLDAEPVLGCGLKTSAMSGSWERRDDLDEHVPLSVVTTTDADVEARRFQVAPVPDEGPQVVATLLRSADHDDVTVSVSHNVADGQSVKDYAYLLADLYTHLAADPSYVPDPDLATRPEARDVWNALTEQQRQSAVKEPRPTMPNWLLPSKGASGRGRTVRELALGPQRFAALKAYGREHGATVNDMLLTAFFRAMTAEFPQDAAKRLSVSFAAEHRRYLEQGARLPISNLAVTIWLALEPRPGETFDETLARMVEQTTLWRGTLWGLRGAMNAAGMARIGYGPLTLILSAIAKMSAGSGKTSPVFTNIGVLDEARLSFGDAAPAAARMSGPAAFGASFVPTISTYRDTLTVSMGFCEEDLDASTVEDVLRRMDQELAFA